MLYGEYDDPGGRRRPTIAFPLEITIDTHLQLTFLVGHPFQEELTIGARVITRHVEEHT